MILSQHLRSKDTPREWGVSSWSFPLVVVAMTLMVGVMLGVFGTYAWVGLIGAMVLALLIMLRQDELGAMLVIAVHLYVDWYLAFRVVALVMVFVFLLVFFLTRSDQHPWATPPRLCL